jgi:hypothetical protein
MMAHGVLHPIYVDDPGSIINVAKNNKNDKAITGTKIIKIKPHRKTNKHKNNKKNKESK